MTDYTLRGRGPYTARSAIDKPVTQKTFKIVHPGVCEWYEMTVAPEDWPHWYVTNDGRTNVLSFKGGAVFTSRDEAEKIAAEANSK